VRGIEAPLHYDYQYLRDTPSEVRAMIKKRGWRRVIAFHSQAPMQCAQHELTCRAAQQVEANLLIHPAVGMTRPGDLDQFTRVRCYEHIIKRYPDQTSALSLLPLAMRMAGPREALWHALIRKNFGCTHFIVMRDHAGRVKTRDGKAFYEPNAASLLAFKPTYTLADELGIDVELLPFPTEVREAPPNGGDDTVGARHARVRAAYVAADTARYARWQGVELNRDAAGVDSSVACAGCLWAGRVGAAHKYAARVLAEFWAGRLELDRAPLAAVLDDLGAPGFGDYDYVSDLEKHKADVASRGVYNVPTYVVDGQHFVGRQHLPMIRWLLGGSEGPGPL